MIYSEDTITEAGCTISLAVIVAIFAAAFLIFKAALGL